MISLTFIPFLVLAVACGSISSRTSGFIFSAPLNKIETRTLAAIAKGDTARASALISRWESPNSNVPVTNEIDYLIGGAYIINITVGDSNISHSLAVDTGSSLTFIGIQTPYVPTNASYDTGEEITLDYGSSNNTNNATVDENSSVTVVLYRDDIHVGDLTVTNQSFGVVSFLNDFTTDIDGILGIGPVDLTTGLLPAPDTLETIPTVMDNMYSQKVITEDVISLGLAPSWGNSTNGLITFGGFDPTRISSEITWAPQTTTYPAMYYWGINSTAHYGGTTVITNTAGIVDSGTTLLMMATDFFNTYKYLTNSTYDSTTGLLLIAPENVDELQSLFFNISGTSFELTANAQLVPAIQVEAYGGKPGNHYLMVADLGYPSGEGLDFIYGYVFLERFYSIFDTTNKRIGFAETPYTYAVVL